MDDVDKRLLAEITDNARMPVRQVAEAAGVSREVADYRLKRLEKKEVIKGYRARINLSIFAEDTYIMFLRFNRLEEWNHILDFLRETKYPQWIGRASGRWDVLLLFSTKGKADLKDFLSTVFSEFKDNLQDHLLLTVTEQYKDSYVSLFSDEAQAVGNHTGGEAGVDEVDMRILRMLSDNAKATNKEMAEQVGLTDEAVRYRVSNLEEKKVILGYRTMIDLARAGFRQRAVTLRFAGLGVDEGLLKQLLSKAGWVYQSARTIGAYDATFLAAVRDEQEFGERLRDLRNKMSGFLSDLEVTPVVDMPLQSTVSHTLLS